MPGAIPSPRLSILIPAVPALAIVALLAGCSNDNPTRPEGQRSLSGNVVLSGTARDSSGALLGTRVIGNATGVRVTLLHGASVVDQTVTIDGRYTFSGLIPETYRVVAVVAPGISDSTGEIVVASGDTTTSDTLRLSGAGEISVKPNALPGKSQPPQQNPPQ